MTGFEDKHFGQIMYGRPSLPNFNEIKGLYNYSADNINSGFGILISQDQHPWLNSYQFGGSYQYTFNLSETAKLAVGTSLRYISSSTRGSYQDLFGWKNREFLKLGFGTAFSWNNLNVGLDIRNLDLIPNENPNLGVGTYPKLSILKYLGIHAWYDFEIGNNFILSPSIVTSNNSNFNFLNLRGEHFNRVWWVLGYSPEDYVSIGAGVNLFNQLHIGYNLDFNVIFKSSRYHSFTLSYRLEK